MGLDLGMYGGFDLTICTVCHDRYVSGADTVCHACREQEFIDWEYWLDDDLPEPDEYPDPDDDDSSFSLI